MSFVPPPANQLVNFVAASRKNAMIPSGFSSPNDNLAYIWTPPGGGTGGGPGTPTNLTPSPNGSTLIFTSLLTVVNQLVLFWNGVYQVPGTSYTLAGSIVTFAGGALYTPQTGDVLTALVS